MAKFDPPRRHPSVECKRIEIRNSHGEKLVGILHETGSKELVIVCHGFRSKKERIPMVNLAIALEKQGISAFRFDFAGNGESEGVFQYGNYRREVNDLCAVVRYFQADNRPITALVGHSKGGNVVLLYASIYHDISKVVNISGRFDLKRGMEGRLGKDFRQKIEKIGYIDVQNKKGKVEYRVTRESLFDRVTTDTLGSCLSISNLCRVLTVHGTMDEMVPVGDAKEFDKYISNHKLHIIQGADHEFTQCQDKLASLVLDFIIDHRHENKDIGSPLSSSARDEKFINSRI